jgi:hypothetical protein
MAIRKPLRRPPQPCLGRGRLQVIARNLLAVEGPQSTSAIIDSAYPWQTRSNGMCVSMLRALLSIGAKRVGRAKTIGRPWIWSLE